MSDHQNVAGRIPTQPAVAGRARTLAKIFLSGWSVPAGLLILLAFTFGPLIPSLGYFWDDWPVILTGRLQGAAGFWQFYRYDRPFSAWTYVLTFPLLGSQPIYWHIFTLLLRWGTAVAMWWTLLRLWPNHRREVTQATLLFAIYPVFTQQSISVAYSQHWICYLLFFLSLGLMVESYHRPRWFWLLTGLSLAASLLELLTMEYFAGLELLRPILLWMLVSEQSASFRKRLATTTRGWLPYLLALSAFVVWRLFWLRFPGGDANPPILLHKILSNPIAGGLRFLQIAIQDSLHLIIAAWTNILAPASINLQDRFVLLSWGAALLAAFVTIRLLLNMRPDPLVEEQSAHNWNLQALLLGATALLLGMLPVWLTDRQIIVGFYSDRFGLPAMFGASLLLVAGMQEVVRKPVQRIVLVGLLIGMAAGMHLRVANQYRWSWVRQTRFYWQLSWRAPALQPGTAVVSDGEIFPYVGLYSTSAAINLLYPPAGSSSVEDPSRLPYWFYSLGRDFAYNLSSFRQGMPLEQNFRHYQFTGDSRQSIVIFNENSCLEVLTPEDSSLPDLPQISASVLSSTNLARIQAGPTAAGFPPTEIFGPEPEHGWCYLYEKAALAQQQGDWQQVVALGEEARGRGFTPQSPGSNTSSEWLPFIEGYARIGRWQDAQALSLAAYERDRRIDARMCSLWGKLAKVSSDGQEAASAVRAKIGCP